MKYKIEFRGKSEGQKKYILSIVHNTITVCHGPAGTGKSIIPLAIALQNVCSDDPNRLYKQLVITRPLVSVGKDIGSLPGTIDERIAPYFRPAYGNMVKILGGVKPVDDLIKSRTILFEPLELMRGMTYDNAFIVVDEAQDTLPEQMLMVLTRLGQNSKIIINGDNEQSDLKGTNGLDIAIRAFEDTEYSELVVLTDRDQQRNALINKITKDFKYAEQAHERKQGLY